VASIPSDIEGAALVGFKVFPTSRSSRAAAYPGAHLAATDDLNQIARWCREYPSCNWRLIFGPSGLWGLDVDRAGATHAADGIAALRALVAVHGALPPRPTSLSGGGGYGLIFRHNGERIVGKTGYPAPGIDPRRGLLSLTIPPSIHVVTRQPYRWAHGWAPWDVAPPIAPRWLVRLVEMPPEPKRAAVVIDTSDQARRRLYRAALAVIDAPLGSRNETLNRRAYQVGRMIGAGLLGEMEAVEALYGAARQAGLDHVETRDTIRSGINSGRRNPMEAGDGR
jgi:hypothetical protein